MILHSNFYQLGHLAAWSTDGLNKSCIIMYWPGCHDKTMRQKRFQPWVRVTVFFRSPPFTTVVLILITVLSISASPGVLTWLEREKSMPHHPHSCSCPITWDVMCLGIVIQAICPNPGATPSVGTYCPYCFSSKTFWLIIQFKQWGYALDFMRPITFPNWIGKSGIPEAIRGIPVSWHSVTPSPFPIGSQWR